MKKYEVNMAVTVSLTIEVEADSQEQAEKLAMDKFDREEMFHLKNYDSIWEREVTEVHESEEEQPEQLSFSELIDKLQYFSIDDSQTMTIGEICDECREYIRKHGHGCLDECIDEDSEAEEWMKENHPESDGMEWSAVLYHPLEFLCEDEYVGDVVLAEMNIDFYGDWGKGIGVFNVYH